MVPMAVNWGEVTLFAGKGFGVVFLVLIILAVITWLVGLVFQRIKRGQEKAKSATKVEETKAKN
jgi:Na+-transporting methylmalonyl-CoA/oxaloacetate decarboxylase gamma subunit